MTRARSFAHIAITALLCVLLLPAAAFGEVRKDDLVGGDTVERRGLPANLAPAIAANSSILVDSDGKVYFERNADERVQIASITKIMTALVALECAPLDLLVEVSERAASTGESTAQLQEGDSMTLDQALIGLMVPSGNDAAVAIAESVGALLVDSAKESGTDIIDAEGAPIDLGSKDAAYDAFVSKMNEMAGELGCTDTRFTNPHGLDFDEWEQEDMYSSARDVSTIASKAMEIPTFQETVSTEKANLQVTRNGSPTSIPLASTDELLGDYEDARGIKTGFTDKAGQCFAGAFSDDERYVYAIVLDSTTNEQRFDDAMSLYEWMLASETDYKLANSDETTTMETKGASSEVPVFGYAALSAWEDRSVPVTLADPQASVLVSSIFGNVSQDVTFEEIPGGVEAGDVVGHVDFYQGNEVIASQDLIACESVEGPSILDSINKGLRSMAAVFTGADIAAESVVLNQMPLLVSKS